MSGNVRAFRSVALETLLSLGTLLSVDSVVSFEYAFKIRDQELCSR